jgi:glycosyltransferase involved in cell wall biosynthesis
MTGAVIVIPCYNEAARLRVADFVAYAGAAPDLALLFVDDGSRDATWEVLQKLQQEAGPSVHLLRKSPNGGKAEAVRDGMNYALDRLSPEIVGFWDADLATPLEAIQDLRCILLRQPAIEMVFGSRVRLLGRHIERRPIRHYLGRLFATVVSNLLRLPIYDTQCGAKLFRATPELRDVLREPFVSRWVFDVEIIARFIRRAGGDAGKVAPRIYEFPLHVWEDIAGSKVKPTDFFKAFRDVLRIRRRYLRS